MDNTAEEQLAAFIAKYKPEIAARHIVLGDVTDLARPEIAELVVEALKCATRPLAEDAPAVLLSSRYQLNSVSAVR